VKLACHASAALNGLSMRALALHLPAEAFASRGRARRREKTSGLTGNRSGPSCKFREALLVCDLRLAFSRAVQVFCSSGRADAAVGET